MRTGRNLNGEQGRSPIRTSYEIFTKGIYPYRTSRRNCDHRNSRRDSLPRVCLRQKKLLRKPLTFQTRSRSSPARSCTWVMLTTYSHFSESDQARTCRARSPALRSTRVTTCWNHTSRIETFGPHQTIRSVDATTTQRASATATPVVRSATCSATTVSRTSSTPAQLFRTHGELLDGWRPTLTARFLLLARSEPLRFRNRKSAQPRARSGLCQATSHGRTTTV